MSKKRLYLVLGLLAISFACSIGAFLSGASFSSLIFQITLITTVLLIASQHSQRSQTSDDEPEDQR